MPKPVVPKPISTKRKAPTIAPARMPEPRPMTMPSPMNACAHSCMSSQRMSLIALLVSLGTIACLGLIMLFFLAKYRTEHDVQDRLGWREVAEELRQERLLENDAKKAESMMENSRMVAVDTSFLSYAIDREAHRTTEPVNASSLAVRASVEIDNCTQETDGPCGGELQLLAAEGVVGKQTFYLAEPGGAGLTWFGPYTDSIDRIIREMGYVKSIAK